MATEQPRAETARAARLAAFVQNAKQDEADADAAFMRSAPPEARELANLVGEGAACRVLRLGLIVCMSTDGNEAPPRAALDVKRDLDRIAQAAAELTALLEQGDICWHLDLSAKARIGLAVGRAYYRDDVAELRPRLELLATLASEASGEVIVQRGPKRDPKRSFFFLAVVNSLRRDGVRMAHAESSVMTRAVRLVFQCFGRDPEPVRDHLRRATGRGGAAALASMLQAQQYSMPGKSATGGELSGRRKK